MEETKGICGTCHDVVDLTLRPDQNQINKSIQMGTANDIDRYVVREHNTMGAGSKLYACSGAGESPVSLLEE